MTKCGVDQALIWTKLGHGLDLKVPPEGSELKKLTSHGLVIVKLANLWESNEAKSIGFVLVEWHGSGTQQDPVVAETMTHGHVLTPNNIV